MLKASHTKPLCKAAKPTEQATLNTHFQKLYRFFYKLLPPLFYLNSGGRPFIERVYNPDNYFSSSSSRLVILLRLIARVEALWNSAEVVGWIIPPTPRSISIRLNDTIKR